MRKLLTWCCRQKRENKARADRSVDIAKGLEERALQQRNE